MKKSKSRKKKTIIRRRQFMRLSLFFLAFIAGTVLFFHFNRAPYTDQMASNDIAFLTNDTEDRLYRQLSDVNGEAIPVGQTVTVRNYYLVKKAYAAHPVVYAQIELEDGEFYYVQAENLELQLTNPVNQAIAQLGFPQLEVQENIQSQFAKWPYNGGKPSGVLVHDTGNDDSTLENEISFMVRNYTASGIFVHAFIDQNQIEVIADSQFMAQGAGANANPRFIQFELIRESSSEGFIRELANAAYYAALMLRTNDLPLTIGQEDGSGTLWTHEMASYYLGGTDHTDPSDYWAQSAEQHFLTTYTIEDFRELVQVYYNNLQPE